MGRCIGRSRDVGKRPQLPVRRSPRRERRSPSLRRPQASQTEDGRAARTHCA
ncbi:unnamed protein product, partial [Ascophyllum nodosum]